MKESKKNNNINRFSGELDHDIIYRLNVAKTVCGGV